MVLREDDHPCRIAIIHSGAEASDRQKYSDGILDLEVRTVSAGGENRPQIS